MYHSLLLLALICTINPSVSGILTALLTSSTPTPSPISSSSPTPTPQNILSGILSDTIDLTLTVTVGSDTLGLTTAASIAEVTSNTLVELTTTPLSAAGLTSTAGLTVAEVTDDASLAGVTSNTLVELTTTPLSVTGLTSTAGLTIAEVTDDASLAEITSNTLVELTTTPLSAAGVTSTAGLTLAEVTDDASLAEVTSNTLVELTTSPLTLTGLTSTAGLTLGDLSSIVTAISITPSTIVITGPDSILGIITPSTVSLTGLSVTSLTSTISDVVKDVVQVANESDSECSDFKNDCSGCIEAGCYFCGADAIGVCLDKVNGSKCTSLFLRKDKCSGSSRDVGVELQTDDQLVFTSYHSNDEETEFDVLYMEFNNALSEEDKKRRMCIKMGYGYGASKDDALSSLSSFAVCFDSLVEYYPDSSKTTLVCNNIIDLLSDFSSRDLDCVDSVLLSSYSTNTEYKAIKYVTKIKDDISIYYVTMSTDDGVLKIECRFAGDSFSESTGLSINSYEMKCDILINDFPYELSDSNLGLLAILNTGTVGKSSIGFSGGGYFSFVKSFSTDSGVGNIAVKGYTESDIQITTFSLTNCGSSSKINWDPYFGFNPFYVQSDFDDNDTDTSSLEGEDSVSAADRAIWAVLAICLVFGLTLIIIAILFATRRDRIFYSRGAE